MRRLKTWCSNSMSIIARLDSLALGFINRERVPVPKTVLQIWDRSGLLKHLNNNFTIITFFTCHPFFYTVLPGYHEKKKLSNRASSNSWGFGAKFCCLLSWILLVTPLLWPLLLESSPKFSPNLSPWSRSTVQSPDFTVTLSRGVLTCMMKN